MISKDQRLRTKKDFSRLFKIGRIFHSVGISLKIAKNNLPIIRFGFVISAKVTKKATKRNKIRRRLRSIVGKNLMNIKNGYDVAFLGRKEVLELSFKELEQSVVHLLGKAGLLKVKND
jgi:ribonuclease P protein component